MRFSTTQEHKLRRRDLSLLCSYALKKVDAKTKDDRKNEEAWYITVRILRDSRMRKIKEVGGSSKCGQIDLALHINGRPWRWESEAK